MAASLSGCVFAISPDHSIGSQTSSSRKGDDSVRAKLDRGFGNTTLQQKHGEGIILVLPITTSDHHAFLLKFQ